jgi:phi13 family phage major tail protein
LANKVKFGLRNAHYAVKTETGYSLPAAFPGQVSLSLSPKGDKAEFYADDVLYFTQEANQGYEGEMTIADVPDSFLKDCLGYTQDENGAIFENTDAVQTPFALMFEVQGDDQPRRFVFYQCTAARPSFEFGTKQASIEPNTDTLSFIASPRDSDGLVKAVLVRSEANNAAFIDFFADVYEFVAPAEPQA